jgi:hypothetical protein
MDIKDILQFILSPKILAAVGGTAAYYFWGRKQHGYKQWMYTGGGMAAGFILGRLAQGYLSPGQVPAQQQLPAQATASGGLTAEEKAELARMVDLDSPVRALPPPTPEPEPQRIEPGFVMSPTGTRTPNGDIIVETGSSIAREDVPLLDGVGSYGESLGGNGLGSYSGNDHDKEIDELMREIAKSPRRGRA